MREVRSEHIPTSSDGSFAGGGGRVEIRAGRNSGSIAQLQDERALVEHADRYSQVHRLRKLRARLPDGERCAGWELPHLGRAVPRIG